jgi:hypothetical protein
MPDPNEYDLGRSRGAVIRRRLNIPGVQWLIFLRAGAELVTGGVSVYGGFSTPLERSVPGRSGSRHDR